MKKLKLITVLMILLTVSVTSISCTEEEIPPPSQEELPPEETIEN